MHEMTLRQYLRCRPVSIVWYRVDGHKPWKWIKLETEVIDVESEGNPATIHQLTETKLAGLNWLDSIGIVDGPSTATYWNLSGINPIHDENDNLVLDIHVR